MFAIFIVLIGVFLSIYKQYLTHFINYAPSDTTTKLFSSEELQKYNGIDNPELYLAILGNVFDVTKGKKHYGPGETYNVFAGNYYKNNAPSH